MQTLGDRLRAQRERAGISRKQLSAQTKIGYSTLAEIERGGMRTTTKLHVLAKALNVADEWLATGHGPRERTASAAPAPAATPAPTPRELDRQLLTTAVEAARRETARLRLSDRQFAAVVEMLYDALVRDLEIDRRHDTVAGMLRAFELEDKPNV